MITTFKLANDLFDPTVAKEFLCFNGNENERYELRRHNYYIKKESFKKDIRKFVFRNRITNQWNALPASVVNAPSINAFKCRLDGIWTSEMFDPSIHFARK